MTRHFFFDSFVEEYVQGIKEAGRLCLSEGLWLYGERCRVDHTQACGRGRGAHRRREDTCPEACLQLGPGR